jgi:endoglucanase
VDVAPDAGSPGSPDTVSAESEIVGASSNALSPRTRFYNPSPCEARTECGKQVKDLTRAGRYADALRVKRMGDSPHAAWFVDGTPREVERAVRRTVQRAAREHEVPVLVAYNLPFRDCAQYSSGGAIDTTAYNAWIDGFARGIGDAKAVVILEPDGLGIIPYNTTIYGAEDWCKPTVTDENGATIPAPGANPTERYAQLNHAVDALAASSPRALVYLDGSHSGWLGVGEAAYRLATAGLARTKGFFLNVSNYRPSAELELFGGWVSSCYTAATAGVDWARGHFDWCPSQYNQGTLDYSPEYAATVTASLGDMLGGATPTVSFVVDTGRNGQGAWEPDPAASYPDAQTWCNPPGRGAGARSTANTGVALLDARLWIKVPGESDGSCNRGISGSTTDPEWGGIVDPPAGDWFREQALELARLASPSLL